MWKYDPEKAAGRIRELVEEDGRSALAISRAATGGREDAVKDIKRHREPSVTRAFNLAHELRCDVAYLIGVSDERHASSPAPQPNAAPNSTTLKYAIARVIRSNLAETDGYLEDEHVDGLVERILRVYERTVRDEEREAL